MDITKKEKERLKKTYGEWALVTGASSGIGLELATLLAQAGLNLVLHGRNREKLEHVAGQLRNQYNIKINTVASDLSDTAGVDDLIQSSSGLNIGLLVVSAGFGTSGLFTGNSIHAEVNMLRVNCEALLILTHHFGQIFAQKKRGGIILMSSMVAFQGTAFSANYAATKAYVQTLGEGLHEELKPYGVDVLLAAPGPVESGFASRANMAMSMSLKPHQIGIPILNALGRRTTVLPGFLTKLLVYSLRTVPRWGKIKIMKKVMGGMTAHQR